MESAHRYFRIGAPLILEWTHQSTGICNMKSELSDESCCYLCGSSNNSLVRFYRKTGSIGIISLNNWYVTDFRIEESDIDL